MSDWKNRIVGHGVKPADQFAAHPNNPRRHPQPQRDAVRASLDTLGWIGVVIENVRTGYLIDGHERVMQALEDNVDVPYIQVDLSEDEEAQALLTFDWITQMAQYDRDALDGLLRSVNSDDAVVQALLSSIADEHDLYPDPAPVEDAGAQIDRAEELLQVWQVERGQLWVIPSKSGNGEHRLLCGDSTNADDVARAMAGERAEYGIHDPPYGINVVKGSATVGGTKAFGTVGAHNKVKVNHYTPIAGDDKPFDPSHLLQASKYCLLWGANYYADKLPPTKGWIVWDKKGRANWEDNFSDCELAWTNMPIVTSIVYHTWMGMVQEGGKELRFHPTQKPSAMLVKLMSQHCPNKGIVIDFYGGSGTTMVACEQLARQCRMIEIEPKYCAVILQRMKDIGLEPHLVK